MSLIRPEPFRVYREILMLFREGGENFCFFTHEGVSKKKKEGSDLFEVLF